MRSNICKIYHSDKPLSVGGSVIGTAFLTFHSKHTVRNCKNSVSHQSAMSDISLESWGKHKKWEVAMSNPIQPAPDFTFTR